MSADIKTWQERAGDASRNNEHVEWPVIYMKAEIAELRAALAATSEELEEWRFTNRVDELQRENGRLRAALEAARQPVAVEGWKLVPIDPTDEMLACGDVHMDGISQLGDAWASMLAAAPVLQVSEHWQLVPEQCTDEMIVAFAEEWYSRQQCIDDPDMKDAYAAMLAVVPAAPAPAAPVDLSDEQINAIAEKTGWIPEWGDRDHINFARALLAATKGAAS